MEEELDFLNKRIKADRKKREELETKKASDEAAKKLHDYYNGLLESGFTEEQAFRLLVEIVKVAFNNS